MNEIKRVEQTGRFPSIHIEADTLAEAFHKAIIGCYERGYRVETPKHKEGGSLGFDAHITTNISHPDQEPVLHKGMLIDDGRGVMQYILEVTHGIHNYWKKDMNDTGDHRWNYTYNERFVAQIPFVLAKIKNDWDNTNKKEGRPRITGRDYFFSTWISGEDSITEQADPPCWQNGQFRFLRDEKGKIFMSYIYGFRSWDGVGGWPMNNIAKTKLMKLFAAKTSDMLGEEINLGSLIATGYSLHIYDRYIDEMGYGQAIERSRIGSLADSLVREGDKIMTLENYIGDEVQQKRLIAAQTDAHKRGLGTNVPKDRLVSEFGYDVDSFPYPADWDTWPKEWDAEPDPKKLARVVVSS